VTASLELASVSAAGSVGAVGMSRAAGILDETGPAVAARAIRRIQPLNFVGNGVHVVDFADFMSEDTHSL